MILQYVYQKQMNLLSGDKFESFLEAQRVKMLNGSTFAFDSKENVEKKYYPNADAFAKRLIPVAVLIIIVCIFFTYRSSSNIFSINSISFATVNFYLGLILVLIGFYRKSPRTVSTPPPPDQKN